jgi:hypothetical protein
VPAQLGHLVQGGAGLLGVLEPEPGQPAQHPGRLPGLPGAVGVYPDPAVRAERVPDRLDPLDVLRLGLAALGHLDLGGPAPDRATIAAACSGPTAGTVTFTGIRSLTGAGHPSVADSTALASQRALSFGPYSANGENSPHPAGPSISALAHRDPPEPHRHRDRERPQPREHLVQFPAHRPRSPGVRRDHEFVKIITRRFRAERSVTRNLLEFRL